MTKNSILAASGGYSSKNKLIGYFNLRIDNVNDFWFKRRLMI
jgi:hypothetical protein